jgi:hypothetical protein
MIISKDCGVNGCKNGACITGVWRCVDGPEDCSLDSTGECHKAACVSIPAYNCDIDERCNYFNCKIRKKIANYYFEFFCSDKKNSKEILKETTEFIRW